MQPEEIREQITEDLPMNARFVLDRAARLIEQDQILLSSNMKDVSSFLRNTGVGLKKRSFLARLFDLFTGKQDKNLGDKMIELSSRLRNKYVEGEGRTADDAVSSNHASEEEINST